MLVDNLHKLFTEGVTTIVCLQHEMHIEHLTCKSIVRTTEKVLTQLSRSQEDLSYMESYFDNANIMSQTGKYPQFDKDYQFQVLHFPMLTHEGGTTKDEEIMDWICQILSHLKSGELIYIHCLDGVSRTGVISAILLGCVYGMSSAEALDAVQRSRDSAAGPDGATPNDHDQKMQVHRILGNASFRQRASSIQPHDKNLRPLETYGGANAPVLRIRMQLAQKGAASFVIFKRVLQAEETSAEKRLFDENALSRMLYSFGISIPKEELQCLLSNIALKRGNIRYVDTQNLCNHVRKPLEGKRLDAVKTAFQLMDIDTDGFVDMNDIATIFYPAGHPDVQANRRTETQVLQEFLDTFPGARNVFTTSMSGVGLQLVHRGGGNRSMNYIDFRSFREYYTDISTAIEDDNYFHLMVWNCWPVRGRKIHRDEDLLKARRLRRTNSQLHYDEEATTESLMVHLKDILLKNDPLMAPAFMAELGRLDADKDGFVDDMEFVEAARNCSVLESEYSEGALMSLFKKLRTEGRQDSQLLSLQTIGDKLKKPLGEARRRCVIAAYEMLLSLSTAAGFKSYTSGNVIPCELIMGEFHAKAHPDVVSGRKSEEFVQSVFSKSIASPTIGSVMTYPKFERYHEYLSGIVEDDSYFCSLVWNMWGVGQHTYNSDTLRNKYTSGKFKVDNVAQTYTNFQQHGTLGKSTAASTSRQDHVDQGPARKTAHVCSRGGYGVGPATLEGVSVSPNRSNVCWQREHMKTHEPDNNYASIIPGMEPKRAPPVGNRVHEEQEDAFGFESWRKRLNSLSNQPPPPESVGDDPFGPYRQRQYGERFPGKGSPSKNEIIGWNSSDHITELLSSSKAISTVVPDTDINTIFETICKAFISHDKGRGLLSLLSFDNFVRRQGQTIGEYDLKRSLNEFGVPLKPEVSRKIVQACATNPASDQISVDGFLNYLCFNWNQKRESFVSSAWSKLHRKFTLHQASHAAGKVDFFVPEDTRIPWNYLVSLYDPQQHPDVRSGSRTSTEVLNEFKDTFPTGYNGHNNDFVTEDEFKWYCRRFSTLCDKDAEFTFVIWSLWHLEDVEDENRVAENELRKVNEESLQRQARTQFRTSVPRVGGSRGWGVENLGWDTTLDSRNSRKVQEACKHVLPQEVIDRLRKSLGQREQFGILQFWVLLHQHDLGLFSPERRPNGLITQQELKSAATEYGLGVSEFEMDKLHEAFGAPVDVERRISLQAFQYNELIRAIVGGSSGRRENLIRQAWERVAGAQSQCSIAVIRQKLSMKQNPDVTRGRITEGQAKDMLLRPLRTLSGSASDSQAISFDLFRTMMLGFGLSAADDDVAFQWLMWNMFLSR